MLSMIITAPWRRRGCKSLSVGKVIGAQTKIGSVAELHFLAISLTVNENQIDLRNIFFQSLKQITDAKVDIASDTVPYFIPVLASLNCFGWFVFRGYDGALSTGGFDVGVCCQAEVDGTKTEAGTCFNYSFRICCSGQLVNETAFLLIKGDEGVASCCMDFIVGKGGDFEVGLLVERQLVETV